MIIRLALSDDVPVVAEIAQAAFEQYIAPIGRKPAPMLADYSRDVAAGHVHVIDVDGVIAGYATCYPKAGFMHLESVAVHPAFVGQGLGRRLVSHVERVAFDAGLRGVDLYTNAKMSGNLTLYPHLKYIEVDRRHENGFDRVYFRKDFQDDNRS